MEKRPIGSSILRQLGRGVLNVLRFMGPDLQSGRETRREQHFQTAWERSAEHDDTDTDEVPMGYRYHPYHAREARSEHFFYYLRTHPGRTLNSTIDTNTTGGDRCSVWIGVLM